MNGDFKNASAVMLILLRVEDGKMQILLQHRANTRFLPYLWDFAVSGHVEEGESMRQAMQRETKEELGLDIDIEALSFSSLIHIKVAEELIYYTGYFTLSTFQGEPRIMEPDKCSELRWFNIDELPQDIIKDRLVALQNMLSGNPYAEIGFER